MAHHRDTPALHLRLPRHPCGTSQLPRGQRFLPPTAHMLRQVKLLPRTRSTITGLLRIPNRTRPRSPGRGLSSIHTRRSSTGQRLILVLTVSRERIRRITRPRVSLDRMAAATAKRTAETQAAEKQTEGPWGRRIFRCL